MNKSDWIEGIARGMAVLESFGTERQRLNATLTAERTGLTRAVARARGGDGPTFIECRTMRVRLPTPSVATRAPVPARYKLHAR